METCDVDRRSGRKLPGRFSCSGSDRGMLDEDIITATRAGGSVLLTGDARRAQAAARRIHDGSSRRGSPFTVIDCREPAATVIDQMMQAIGGILPESQGETAIDGSVYLKHVGALPLDVQRLLAGLLVQPGRRRVIASSSEPLLGRMVAGEFDDCLFYRLNVIHIMLDGGA